MSDIKTAEIKKPKFREAFQAFVLVRIGPNGAITPQEMLSLLLEFLEKRCDIKLK